MFFAEFLLVNPIVRYAHASGFMFVQITFWLFRHLGCPGCGFFKVCLISAPLIIHESFSGLGNHITQATVPMVAWHSFSDMATKSHMADFNKFITQWWTRLLHEFEDGRWCVVGGTCRVQIRNNGSIQWIIIWGWEASRCGKCRLKSLHNIYKVVIRSISRYNPDSGRLYWCVWDKDGTVGVICCFRKSTTRRSRLLTLLVMFSTILVV